MRWTIVVAPGALACHRTAPPAAELVEKSSPPKAPSAVAASDPTTAYRLSETCGPRPWIDRRLELGPHRATLSRADARAGDGATTGNIQLTVEHETAFDHEVLVLRDRGGRVAKLRHGVSAAPDGATGEDRLVWVTDDTFHDPDKNPGGAIFEACNPRLPIILLEESLAASTAWAHADVAGIPFEYAREVYTLRRSRDVAKPEVVLESHIRGGYGTVDIRSPPGPSSIRLALFRGPVTLAAKNDKVDWFLFPGQTEESFNPSPSRERFAFGAERAYRLRDEVGGVYRWRVYLPVTGGTVVVVAETVAPSGVRSATAPSPAREEALLLHTVASVGAP